MVLRASDAILAKNLAIVRANKQLLEGFMARRAGLFTWVPPKAGAVAAIRSAGWSYKKREKQTGSTL